MTPEDVEKSVVEALGPERAAIFKQLVSANAIDRGFAYNALLVQLYVLRLADDIKTSDAGEGRILRTQLALAKSIDHIDLQTQTISGKIDNIEKSSRNTSEQIRGLTNRSTRTRISRSPFTIAMMIGGGAILLVLVCAIVWSVGFQRGSRERAYGDAALSHRDPEAWTRFVRSEIGR